MGTATIRRLHVEGENPAHIAKRLGVARSTVYEALKVATKGSRARLRHPLLFSSDASLSRP